MTDIIYTGSIYDAICVTCDQERGSNFVDQYILNDTNDDMAVDGSETPVVFAYTPPLDQVFYLFSLSLFMRGSTSFTYDGFGSGDALSNGCKMKMRNVETACFKTNLDISLFLSKVNPCHSEVPPSKELMGQKDFGIITGGRPIQIDSLGFKIEIHDNLDISGFTFKIKVKGILRSEIVT